MTSAEVLAEVQKLATVEPVLPQHVDAPEVEMALRVGGTLREASKRACDVFLILENWQLCWHWRVVIQIGWAVEGKGEERRNRPDCIGTQWKALGAADDLAAAYTLARAFCVPPAAA